MAASSCMARWSLAGATALVTGGGRGIGRAIVEELASLGARVHACDRDEASLSRCQQARNLAAVTTSACDVSVRADREALVGRVSAMFDGKLNILVNNAGTSCTAPAVEVTAEEYSRVMATNFESCFHFNQLAHPLLKASGSGSIVSISSITSFLGYHAIPIYSASKGAMNQVTRNLASEWVGDGIRVNCVAPGAINTSLLHQFQSPKLSQAIVHMHLLLLPAAEYWKEDRGCGSSLPASPDHWPKIRRLYYRNFLTPAS